MPVTITIPAPLRQFAGGQSQIVVEAKTAGEALDLLTSTHAALRRHLFNDQNALRNFVNVYLNARPRRPTGPTARRSPAGSRPRRARLTWGVACG
jgi:hypothetical protein